jgi:hypothetical protein
MMRFNSLECGMLMYEVGKAQVLMVLIYSGDRRLDVNLMSQRYLDQRET